MRADAMGGKETGIMHFKDKDWRVHRIRSRIARLLALPLLVLTLGACDSLLDVNVPGAVDAEELRNPQLAGSLLVAALGEVECATAHYVDGTAILADEYIVSAFWRNFNIWGARLAELETWTGPCQSGLGASNLGFYVALSRARFMTDDAFQRIDAFAEGELSINKNASLATLAAYSGYAHTMLGEGFCEMAIDGGPLMTRAQVFEAALEKFRTAEQLAQSAGDASIQNMSLVGQARILLNLGRATEAAAAARRVPQGFVRNATFSTTDPRRHNRVAVNSHRNLFTSVSPRFRDLTIDGNQDSRVGAIDTGRTGHDNLTPLFLQTKYPDFDSPIPLASWREAQLIVAEAELGQSAVDRINTLRDYHGLPRWEPTDVNDSQAILAQVIEERRRELFLEGHRLNDKLRFGIPFPTGANHKGEPYGPVTCLPLPRIERDSNPNIA